MKLHYLAAAIMAVAGTPALAAGTDAKASANMSSSSASGGARMSSDAGTIKKVQQELNQKGYRTSVNGKMSSETQAALQKFQSDKGLSATGSIDQPTLVALGISQSAPANRAPSGPDDAGPDASPGGMGGGSSSY
jgi:peptidoglycan hydrolase-like protein with peptidoglycan-binding domain